MAVNLKRGLYSGSNHSIHQLILFMIFIKSFDKGSEKVRKLITLTFSDKGILGTLTHFVSFGA